MVTRLRNRHGYVAAKQRKAKQCKPNTGIDKIFNEDQLQLLSGKIKKVKKWSDATIMDSLQMKFACQGGYDKLIAKGYPFPSTRTLLRRIEDIEFSPGNELIFI